MRSVSRLLLATFLVSGALGCSASSTGTTTAPKMSGDKMKDDKMMGGDKMKDDKMMDGGKMKDDKMMGGATGK